METNLALGRPATQSSISIWSRFPTVEADAAGANNGKIDGSAAFHTDREENPWWQVDLQAICTLRTIRLFNRQTCAERLRHFSVLCSLDGSRWLPIYRKTDEGVFGAKDLTPYIINMPLNTVGRFVRIRVDGRNCLHFSQCEVFGEEVDAASAAPLETAFMERLTEFERSTEDRHTAFSAGRRGHIAIIGDSSIFVDVNKYSPTLIKALDDNAYEARERGIVSALARSNDRILEIGTAVGAVTMAAARIVGATNVVTYDANPQIVADARRNFLFNDLGEIQSRIGVLCNRLRFKDTPDSVDFSISRDFWASRLNAGQNCRDIVQTIRVPTACLEDQITAHRATMLMCDIEGGEIDLLTDADLSGIRLLVMEVHSWAGIQLIDAMMRKLICNGLNIDLAYSGSHIAVLRR